MSKKTISKVVAVICVIAMCFTAVFTGAVSADNRSATCEVKGYAYNYKAGDVYVGYEATFTSGTAFTAGSFTIDLPSDLKFIDCTAKVSSVDGYVPNVYLNVQNNKVLFAGFSETSNSDIQSFTSLTLVLKFSPTTAIKDCAAGKTWAITLGSISITNAAEETYTCSNATGTAHVHNFTGAATVNGVTTKTCSVCDAVDKTIDSSATSSLGSNNLAATKQATLNFAADGDTILCALVPTSSLTSLGGTTYFVYKYKDDDAEEKTATSVASGTMGTYTVFPCGRNGGMGRMSRNITGNFISGSTISAEWSYSIKSYLDTLITSGTAAQQNYAMALWNYGYYTTQRLVATTAYFDEDLAAYTGGVKSVADWTLPSSKKATSTGSGSWTVSGVKVETGYKPKMHIKLNAGGSTTVEAYNTDGDLVYRKTITATSGDFFTISDIPTKYLTGTLKISMSGSTKVVEYSFGKYAKARVDGSAADANIFQWMMNYAYYLGQAFA